MSVFSRKSDYQKLCQDKIKEICGGFVSNDYFDRLALLYGKEKNYQPSSEKSILEDECKKGTLKLEDIEDRLKELLSLDAEILDEYKKEMDTSKIKTQDDLFKYFGKVYEDSYYEKNAVKVKSQPLVDSDNNLMMTHEEFFKYCELFEKGLISEDEFSSVKKNFFKNLDD